MCPQPDHSTKSQDIDGSSELHHEYSAEERTVLLKLAHDAIAMELEGKEVPETPPTTHLAEPRGAFTTVYVKGELRGCVGYVFPVHSVYRTIVETARSAAFNDTRFESISKEDLPSLKVSLSVLSPIRSIRAEEVEIGRDGLIISLHGNRGLLLPQVPVEHGWNQTRFLEETCRKAGLPRDAWLHGATIEAFSAEVFGDVGAA